MELTNAFPSRIALPALLALSACAGASGPAREDAPSAPLAQQAQATTKTLNGQEMQALNDAEGTFFAAVRAEGAGCPEGTLNTRVSADGQAFTTTFSAYDIRIDPSSDAQTRDCKFVVMLDSPGGRSFCVKQFGYSGNAFLEQGVSGRQVANYSFNEQTLAAESSRQELVGPYDADFVFTDTVQPPEEVWTPCGEQRDLIIDTKLELNNGSPRGAGLINISAADGQNSVTFKLASHRCDMARDDGWTVGPFAGRTDTMTGTGTVTETDPVETPDDTTTPDEDVTSDETPTSNGNTGSSSNSGSRGNTGSSSSSGSRGNTGSSSSSGSRGNTGSSSSSGSRGNTGSSSSSGSRGNTGSSSSSGGSRSSGPSVGSVSRDNGPSIGSVGRTVR